MSGFIGYLRTDGAPVDRDLLAQMTGALAFRGPDGQVAWYNGSVGMGIGLFRTTDEDADDGPATLDGRVWLVGHLRLAGRQDLIRRLRSQGRTVADNAADSALLLHAYAVWGDGCLDYLLGDFAFFLWDEERRRLLGARDHFGVAQCFYALAGDDLLVGNTLQSLLRHPRLSTQLNEQMLMDCALFNLFVDDSATAYAAVHRLPPGHRLCWEKGQLTVAPYWTPNAQPAFLAYRRPAEYVEHFRSLFDEVIADALRTDRAGLHLSGGMDSSSIAATASRQLTAGGRPFTLRGYTMIYRDLIPDEEGNWAAQVAQATQIPQHFIVTEELTLEPSEDPAWLPPEPGASYSPGWNDAAEMTASFARVLLAGFGGDPLLHAPPLSLSTAVAAWRGGAWIWPLRQSVRQMRRRRAQRPLPGWLNPALDANALLARQAMLTERNDRSALGMVSAPLWRSIFAWSDPGYTGRQLMLRFPFFDRRLYDFVRSIPPSPWLERKQILRAAMQDRLPAPILARPKTPLQANPLQALYAQRGVPAWQVAALTAPAMQPYVSTEWLASVQHLAPEAFATAWATARPPAELAYWHSHHRVPPAPTLPPAVQFLSSSNHVNQEKNHANP